MIIFDKFMAVSTKKTFMSESAHYVKQIDQNLLHRQPYLQFKRLGKCQKNQKLIRNSASL